MANIDTWRRTEKNRPQISGGGATPFNFGFSLAAGTSADVIRLMPIPRNTYVVDLVLAISGTLGAGCTLQVRRATTALTAASTAAAANYVGQTLIGHLDVPSSTAEEELNLVIAGANVAATATVTVRGKLVENL
jgi:hypothetical protein